MKLSGQELWTRAAALGSLWAALEIVLGSFLHNLRVPMRGQIMTALAVMLVSAAYRRIGRPGLLWRTGLICAGLKSLSPSSVLMGPMLAITMEGFAMEAGVLAAGPRAGLAVGGGLAMLWTYVHLLGMTVFAFGFDAARLYEAVWGKAQGLLGLGLGPWGALGVAALAHLLVGTAASLCGQRPLPPSDLLAAGASLPKGPEHKPRFSSHPAILAANLGLLFGLLWVARSWPVALSGGVIIFMSAVWAFMYPSAARRLFRPSLWLSLLAVGLAGSWALGAWEAGGRMVLRALAVSAGFAAIGQELAGSSVRRFLFRLGAEPLQKAMAAAFDALPRSVAALPEPKEFLLSPGRALAAALKVLDD